MTLATLLNDGPYLSISPVVANEGALSFDWSDFPVVEQSSWDAADVVSKNTNYPAHHQLDGSNNNMIYHQQTSSSPDFSSRLDLLSCRRTSIPRPSPPTGRDVRATETKKPKRQQKQVKFSQFLEVRRHSLTIGDHPHCELLPISLDWEHACDEIVALESFEVERDPIRRSGDLLRLSYGDRKNRLREVGGVSEADIKRSERSSRAGFTFHHVSTIESLDALQTIVSA